MLNPTGSNACKLSRLPSPVYVGVYTNIRLPDRADLAVYIPPQQRADLSAYSPTPPQQRADLHECPSSFDYLSDLTIASRYYCSDDGFQYNETINKISCVGRRYYWVSFACHATINGISISHVAQNWKFPECNAWFHSTDLSIPILYKYLQAVNSSTPRRCFQTRANENSIL